MRVFDSNTLLAFGKTHAVADAAVRELNKALRHATWTKMTDVVTGYPSATVLNAERVVFKVKGNAYRAIAAFDFRRKAAFAKFVGTHAEYDKSNALTQIFLERDRRMTLGDAYERQHWPDENLDPVEAIKARRENSGRMRKDLERIVGSSGRASEILNRKRHPTLAMIWRLVEQWKIPAESLVKPYKLATSSPRRRSRRAA